MSIVSRFIGLVIIVFISFVLCHQTCGAVPSKQSPKEQNKPLKSVKTNVHVFVLFRLWAFRSLPGSVVLRYLDDRKINSDGSFALPLFYLPSQLASRRAPVAPADPNHLFSGTSSAIFPGVPAASSSDNAIFEFHLTLTPTQGTKVSAAVNAIQIPLEWKTLLANFI